MKNIELIKLSIKEHYGLKLLDIDMTAHSGGDIHQSFMISLSATEGHDSKQIPDHLFAKLNSALAGQVLRSEFESLTEMNLLCSGLYPKAVLFSRFKNDAVLLMSYHSLSSFTQDSAADAGRALAKQHRVSNAQFGWSNDNFIGLTPQPNTWTQSWTEFFREQRLIPMLHLAMQQGLPEDLQEKIQGAIESLDRLLSHIVIPSLVHGDLWSGNLAFDQSAQQPLFYDPAPYFGDREVDLAMTELFGRQPSSFYHAYQQEYPIEDGYEQRRAVYNLYHALNHVVLFGQSYNALVSNCLARIEMVN